MSTSISNGLNPDQLHINGERIAVVSSCARYLPAEPGPLGIREHHERCEVGDLVLGRVLEPGRYYPEIDDFHGTFVRLDKGDLVLGVAANRQSGSQLIGRCPTSLHAGDRLSVVALGGLVGHCVSMPPVGPPPELEVLGAVTSDSGDVLNTRQMALRYQSPPTGSLSGTGKAPAVAVILGSSADAGKTTLVGALASMLRQKLPNAKLSYVKGGGSGRRHDIRAVSNCGFDLLTDFVDHGWPSTYGMADTDFAACTEEILARVSSVSDVVLYEIGGDMLEAGAPTMLSLAARHDYPVLVMVNDALGAQRAQQICAEAGVRIGAIGSLRQNVTALRERLGDPEFPVLRPDDQDAVARVVNEIVAA